MDTINNIESPPEAIKLAEVWALLDQGDWVGAASQCRSRLTENPDDADAHRHLGQLLAASGDFLPAHRSARRACELAPEDPRGWSDLGRVYPMDGKLDDAARCFTSAEPMMLNLASKRRVLESTEFSATRRVRAAPVPGAAVRG